MAILRVGLTGGIGSGKTTVSDLFAELGVEVIDADVIAHEVTAPGEAVLDEIAAEFGPRAICSDGGMDRGYMRSEVFSNPDKRRRLEAILHPVIRERMELKVRACSGPYCILSIPLLIESRNAAKVDRVLVVDAPDDRRREWIRARSGLSDAEINGIFAAQVSREARIAAADDVIVNDGPIEALKEKVEALHARYLEIAAVRVSR